MSQDQEEIRAKDEALEKELKSALKQLNKIIEEEIKVCLQKGKTTLEAVDKKVKARTSMLMQQLGTLLAERYRRLMIGRKLNIPYLDTHEFERAAALKLLADSIAADQQTYLAMKSGNEFAASLVARYGDKPLWKLYQFYLKDQKRKKA
jgi:hypothetical protein